MRSHARLTYTQVASILTEGDPELSSRFSAVVPFLRRRFRRAKAGIVPGVNVLGLTAAEAAWRDGAEWLAAQNAYLRGNREFPAGDQRTRAGPGG